MSVWCLRSARSFNSLDLPTCSISSIVTTINSRENSSESQDSRTSSWKRYSRIHRFASTSPTVATSEQLLIVRGSHQIDINFVVFALKKNHFNTTPSIVLCRNYTESIWSVNITGPSKRIRTSDEFGIVLLYLCSSVRRLQFSMWLVTGRIVVVCLWLRAFADVPLTGLSRCVLQSTVWAFY